MTAAPLLAHAFGQRYDLPVPLVLFVVGGAAVVFVSFLVVLPRPVRPLPGGVPQHDGVPLRRRAPLRMAAAWLLFLGLALAGWIGSQEVAENIVPTAFWLLVWIGVPISCGVIGDWTQSVNPFLAVARVFDRPALRRALIGGDALIAWPRGLGHWPAAVLFFVIANGELVYNGTATLPSVTATAMVTYMVLNALGGLLFGSGAWAARGEVFSVLWNTWGRLGWWRHGSPGPRGFGGGLAAPFEPTPSRLTFMLLLLVSVSFDGLLATPAWKTAAASLPDLIARGTFGYGLVLTLAFLVLVGLAWLLFGGFALAVRAAGRLLVTPLATLAGLMQSLLPISFGYLLAHNADYLAINGQLLIPLLGNPTGIRGMRLLPAPFGDAYEINRNLLPSSVLWYLEVVLIVGVHIAAVVLAHGYLARTARTAPEARRAEWPWILVMVGYTMTSLWLLAQPVVD